MCDSNSSSALNDFKKQLDTLSESLHHFDPEERNKALEILHECIQGLENKTNFPLSEDLQQDVLQEINDSPDIEEQGVSYNSINSVADEGNLSNGDFEVINHLRLSNRETSGYELVRNEEGVSSRGQEVKIEEASDHIVSDEGSEADTDEERKPNLKCPLCEVDFEDKNSFMSHLELYTGKLKNCADCNKTFHNSHSFKLHKQLDMCLRTSKMYKCRLCSQTLFGASQYKAHTRAHKRNQCKLCREHFATRKHLESHITNVHKEAVNKDSYRCHICSRTFVQRRSLVYHYKIKHPSNNIICPICLEYFESDSKLQKHLTTHKVTSYTCEKCGEEFLRRQQYLIHMEVHERYKCETCGESFAAKRKATQHARLGHSVSGIQSQLQCAQCGQLFFSQSLLNTHMIEHTGGTKLACEKCKVSFKHVRNYRSHLLTNEHLRGEQPKILHACKECNKTFTNKNNLRVHKNRLHKPDLKELSCTLCSYKTTMTNNLKRHIALHTKKPQFICDKCGSQFQTKSALREHNIIIHSDTKDFSCDKCGKLFNRSSDLNRHLLNTHSESAQYKCHCNNSYRTLSNLRRHQLLTHGEVDITQKRLKKLFTLERNDIPRKKSKKSKKKKEQTLDGLNDLQIMHPQNPALAGELPETNNVLLTENGPLVSYNMDFTNADKTEVMYTQNLDMEGLQEVESMIQLDNDHAKQGTSVLINVRNLFERNIPSDYIISPQIDSSMVNSLETLSDSTQHIVTNQKQDVITNLQDYVMPHDLNFLNV